MTIGTPQYLSPSSAGTTLDARLDFYALGVTLFKAAIGEVPFVSTDWFELARMHVRRLAFAAKAAASAVQRVRAGGNEMSREASRRSLSRWAGALLLDLAAVDGTCRPVLLARWREWWSG